MQATTIEIAPDVFRLTEALPDAPADFGCFLIRDEQSTMIETGMRGIFSLTRPISHRACS